MNHQQGKTEPQPKRRKKKKRKKAGKGLGCGGQSVGRGGVYGGGGA